MFCLLLCKLAVTEGNLFKNQLTQFTFDKFLALLLKFSEIQLRSLYKLQDMENQLSNVMWESELQT